MKRKLFTLLAAISLLLCVATVGLWIRSASTFYSLSLKVDREYFVGSGQWLALGWTSKLVGPIRDHFEAHSIRCTDRGNPHKLYGNWFVWDMHRYEVFPQVNPSLWYTQYVACLPWWFVMVATGLLPLARAATIVRHPRYAAGHCRNCRYDLRATPERCPECGLAAKDEG